MTAPTPAGPRVRVNDARHLGRWGLFVVLPLMLLMIAGSMLAGGERELQLVLATGAAALAIVFLLGFLRGAPAVKG